MDRFGQTALLRKRAGGKLGNVHGLAKGTCQLRSGRFRQTKIREPQAVPRLAIAGSQHECPPIPFLGFLGLPQRMERTPQSQRRLRIVRLEFFRRQQSTELPRVGRFSCKRSRPRNKLGTNNDWFKRNAARNASAAWGYSAGLVLHQPEIAPEFGDIRTDRYGLAIAGRSAAKIAPGLCLMGFGQERFKPGVPLRLGNSQSRGRQGNCE